MGLAGTENPVLYANRASFRVVRKLLDQRAEWLSPIVGQLFHQCDTIDVVFRHGNIFFIGP